MSKQEEFHTSGEDYSFHDAPDNWDFMPGDWTGDNSNFAEPEYSPYGPDYYRETYEGGGYSSASTPPTLRNAPVESALSPSSSYGSRRTGVRGAYGSLLSPSLRPRLPIPTLGPYPTYNLPVRDEAKVSQYTQRAAAPGIRALRSAVQRAVSSNEENPNVRRMSLREALAGYGQGLENVIAGAERAGQSQYNQEYSEQARKADMEYRAEIDRRNANFQAAMQDYYKRFGY